MYELHKVKMTTPRWPDGLTQPIFLWLSINIGKRFGAWNWTWVGNDVCIYFKHEEDKVKFILRWL